MSSEDNDFLDFLRDVHGDVHSLRDEALNDAVGTIEKKAYRAYGAMQNLEKHGNGVPEAVTRPVSVPIPVITDEMTFEIVGEAGEVVAEVSKGIPAAQVQKNRESAEITQIMAARESAEVTEVTQYAKPLPAPAPVPALRTPYDPPKVISGRGADFFAPLETKTRVVRRPKTGSK